MMPRSRSSCPTPRRQRHLSDAPRRLSSELAGTLTALADLEGVVRTALAAPLGLPRLCDPVKPAARVTIGFAG